MTKAGRGNAIHIRFYGVADSVPQNTREDLHAKIKREISNLSVFIVMIDEEPFSWGHHLSHHWSVADIAR